jgi:hypothetical protein
VAVPPAEVVEEAGWARVGSRGEKPTAGSSVEADPVARSLVEADSAATSSWAVDPAAEAPPEPGRDGSAAGASKGSG